MFFRQNSLSHESFLAAESIEELTNNSVAVAVFLEQPAILWTIASVLLAFFYLGLTRRLTSGR